MCSSNVYYIYKEIYEASDIIAENFISGCCTSCIASGTWAWIAGAEFLLDCVTDKSRRGVRCAAICCGRSRCQRVAAHSSESRNGLTYLQRVAIHHEGGIIHLYVHVFYNEIGNGRCLERAD